MVFFFKSILRTFTACPPAVALIAVIVLLLEFARKPVTLILPFRLMSGIPVPARTAFTEACVFFTDFFHAVALLDKIVILTVENHKFTEFTLYRPIQHRNLLRSFQSYLVEKLRLRTYYPSVIAFEHVFQTVADRIVESVHIIGRNTLTIWRIRNEHAVFRSFFIILYCHHFQVDIPANTSALDVPGRYGYSFGRYVGAVDFIFEFTLLRIVVVYLVENLRLVIPPFLESERLAVNTRIDVGSNQRRFYQERAGAAHRVNQVAVAPPSGFQYQTGGKHFINRSFGLLHTVSALIQRLAGTVERYYDVIIRNMHIKKHIGIDKPYRRTASVFFHKKVGNGILHTVSNEL